MGRWPLLLAYAAVNVVLYSMLLPLWEGFDEPFHFGYVQSLANRSGFPDPHTSRLSREVGTSLHLAPESISVKRNLPFVTTYPEFFELSADQRKQAQSRLRHIDPAGRWGQSEFLNYEAQQAPLAYAILAVPERALANVPLPLRVLALRITAGILGAFLLAFAAAWLAKQLGIEPTHATILIFCAMSCQMTWATLARVSNDWLAIPLSVWLLCGAIHYYTRPSVARAALVSTFLALGLLTKAYFLAFLPPIAFILIARRRLRDVCVAAAVVATAAGPWYFRNLERYGTVSGMQEIREGIDPARALNGFHLRELPAALDSYARAALWTANNRFRSFSISTLRMLIVAWLAALVLWAKGRHRTSEWIVVLHTGAFSLALAYDVAINYVTSRGEATSPESWYTQVLLVPMLALAMLGVSRSTNTAKLITALMAGLFGYVLVVTYWVKLIPLYAGFEDRQSLVSIWRLYRDDLPALVERLNDVSLGPATIVLWLSGAVSMLVIGQQIIFIDRLFQGRGLPGRDEGGTL
jgi:hypothetical protein